MQYKSPKQLQLYGICTYTHVWLNGWLLACSVEYSHSFGKSMRQWASEWKLVNEPRARYVLVLTIVLLYFVPLSTVEYDTCPICMDTRKRQWTFIEKPNWMRIRRSEFASMCCQPKTVKQYCTKRADAMNASVCALTCWWLLSGFTLWYGGMVVFLFVCMPTRCAAIFSRSSFSSSVSNSSSAPTVPFDNKMRLDSRPVRPCVSALESEWKPKPSKRIDVRCEYK